MKKPSKKNHIQIVIFSLCISIMAMFIDFSGWMSFSERKHYDLFQNIVGLRAENLKTVLVIIDDATILAHKDEPMTFWGPHFARVIDILNKKGAAAIGIDFLFTVTAESWLKKIGASADEKSRTFDIPLRTQLGSGSVILASIISFAGDKKVERILPPFEYWALMPGARNDIGIANLTYDSDGVSRRLTTDFGFDTSPSLSFSSAIAIKYLQRTGNIEKLKTVLQSVKDTKELPTGFAGPPGTFPRISFQKFLAHDAENSSELDIVKDKIAIITEENSGSQDIHQTPYSLDFPFFTPVMMNGAELHANMVESLVTGIYPEKVSNKVKFGWIFLLLMIASALFNKLSPLKGLIPFFLITAVLNTVAYLLFSNYLIIESAGTEAGLVLSYISFLGLKYSGAEANRKNIKQMFGRYVSDEIVEILAETGQQPELGGKTCEITVLFSDIRNFTTISEILDPEETVEMLNEYFGRICTVILDEGGTVDKFIGDAIMAIFGAPVHIENHAAKAVISALKIADIALEFDIWFKARFAGKDLPDFRAGIGIHTGNALVGNIGSQRRVEYTAIGDTVNTASRIEGKTKELGWTIAASSATMESLKNTETGLLNFFCLEYSEHVELKGKKGKIELYEVRKIPS